MGYSTPMLEQYNSIRNVSVSDKYIFHKRVFI